MEFLRLTGKIKYRISFTGKIILQVEEIGNSYDSRGGGTYSPDIVRWRDATFNDLQTLNDYKKIDINVDKLLRDSK